MSKKNQFTVSKSSSHRLVWMAEAVLVIMVSSLLGLKFLRSSSAVTGNYATCSVFNVSTYYVQTGGTFSSVVHMHNDGSSTWAPNFAVFLGDPTHNWNYLSGYLLTRSYGPGGTIVPFSLTIKAPSTAGTYSLSPKMEIGLLGFFNQACPSKSIHVLSPAKLSSFSASPSKITKGNKTRLSWSGSGSSVTCKLTYGSTTLTGLAASGSKVVAPTKSTSYSLGCSNVISKSSTLSTKVSVSSAPSTPPPSGGGSSNTGGQGGNVTPPAPKDTSAPSTPKSLATTLNSSSFTVDLSWKASTDNVGVKGYKVERSEAGQAWTVLDPQRTATDYEDQNINFSKSYNYRVTAFDAAGNKSKPALANVSTPDFTANLTPANVNTFQSDDKAVSINVPANTFDKPLFCAVKNDATTAPAIKGFTVVGGPYSLQCWDGTNSVVDVSGKAISLAISPSTININGPVVYFVQSLSSTDKQKNVQHDASSNTDTIQMDSGSALILAQAVKKVSPLPTILLVIGMILALPLGYLGFRSYMGKQKLKKQYADYIRKSRGY